MRQVEHIVRGQVDGKRVLVLVTGTASCRTNGSLFVSLQLWKLGGRKLLQFLRRF